MTSLSESEPKHWADSGDDKPVNKKLKLNHGRFRQSQRCCYKDQENGSVYFASFNPEHPYLACGLIDGQVLIINGTSQTDSVNLWHREMRFQSDGISAMTDLAWNMNGNLLAVSFLDGKLSIWHRHSETIENIITPDGQQIWAIAWNPHLPDMFLVRNRQMVLVWDDAHQCQPKVTTPRYNFQTDLLRDVSWIAIDQYVACSDDGKLFLCQLGKEEPIKTIAIGETALSMTWNENLNSMAVLSSDGSIKIWSMNKDKIDHVIKSERPKRPRCLAWLPYCENMEEKLKNNTIIAYGLEDGSVIVNHVMENAETIQNLHEQNNSIWEVSFSPDGKCLVSIDLQGHLVIWSTENWKVIFRTTLAFRTTKQLLVWGCNGHKLAIANPNQQVHLIEAVETED